MITGPIVLVVFLMIPAAKNIRASEFASENQMEDMYNETDPNEEVSGLDEIRSMVEAAGGIDETGFQGLAGME